jgi:hypothetical protein
MKHLKLFEDYNTHPQSIVEELESICLELNDGGFRTECVWHRDSHYSLEHISVGIEKDSKEYEYLYGELPWHELRWGDISESVTRMVDYMESVNWKPSSIIADRESIKDPMNFLKWMELKENALFSGITLNFRKSIH